jgi:hypothetical protein
VHIDGPSGNRTDKIPAISDSVVYNRVGRGREELIEQMLNKVIQIEIL